MPSHSVVVRFLWFATSILFHRVIVSLSSHRLPYFSFNFLLARRNECHHALSHMAHAELGHRHCRSRVSEREGEQHRPLGSLHDYCPVYHSRGEEDEYVPLSEISLGYIRQSDEDQFSSGEKSARRLLASNGKHLPGTAGHLYRGGGRGSSLFL